MGYVFGGACVSDCMLVGVWVWMDSVCWGVDLDVRLSDGPCTRPPPSHPPNCSPTHPPTHQQYHPSHKPTKNTKQVDKSKFLDSDFDKEMFLGKTFGLEGAGARDRSGRD